jgi:uncharacterized membrane protein
MTRSLLVSLALAAGCGSDPKLDCNSSQLTYTAFGQPFMLNWCNGCHSSALPPGQRGDAPVNVNFDTLDDVHMWSESILMTAGPLRPTMPPAGGPTLDERNTLEAWIDCGAN